MKPTLGRILVIDDTLQNRLLAEAQLEAEGYVVTSAENGAEGLALLAREAFDLVLLDVMMPGIDGFETCRRLRKLPNGAEIPVLFLTASHETAIHERAIESGGDDFLRKPIERTELLLRVRSLIRITRLQVAIRRERDALVRLQEQKDLLTALLVHDLKNPLSSVIANTQFVLDNPEVDDRQSALEDVLSAAEAIHQMVMNLLDIGRAEDGALAPSLEEVDVARLFTDLQSYSRRRLALRRQELRVSDLARSPKTIRADASLLSRMLQNLLDNSTKYTPVGGTVHLEAEVVDEAFRLSVRDTGPGIPLDQRARIFEKYGQVEGRVARDSRGLGLVFCRLAAEAHGGKIWVEESHPHGSVFVIEMPLRTKEASC